MRPVASPYTTVSAPHGAPSALPEVQSDPAPSASRGRGLRLALAGVLAAGAVMGLAGCGGVDVPPPPPETSLPGDSFTLSQPAPAVSILGATRIDIFRETTRDSDGDWEDVALSPFGVELGNGLFYDTNGNLTYAAAPQFVVRSPQSASLQAQSLFGRQVAVHGQQQGNSFVLEGRGLFGSARYVIRQDGSTTLMEQPALGGSVVIRIEREGNVTTIRRPALGGSVVVARVIDQGTRTEVRRPALGGDIVVTIDRTGARTTISRPALFSPIVTTVDRTSDSVRAYFPGGTWEVRPDGTGRTAMTYRGPLGSGTATITQDGTAHTVQAPGLFGNARYTVNIRGS